jgi:hypothetical protein
MNLLTFAASLGADLARRFTRAQYDVSDFTSIATDALAARQRDLAFDPDDVIDAAISAALPWQGDVGSMFGEPAITLFSHPRFRIDALCWRNGTTAIHQHQFAGAFYVLWGSSLQTTYGFTPTRIISESFHIGTIAHRDSTTLTVGRIEPIHHGDTLIHAVFHLDAPSITLVVRTHNDVPFGPQFRYERPSVAYDPFAKDYQWEKRLQVVDYLCDVKPAGYAATIARIVRDGNVPLTFAVLRRLRIARADPDVWSSVVRAATDVHGAAIEELLPVFDEIDRERVLIALRRSVKDEPLRYFLALLLNVPSRRDIVDAVRQRVGGADVAAHMVEWVATIKALPSSREPLTDVDRAVLHAVFSSDDAAALARASAAWSDEWRESYARLQRSTLLQSFFDVPAASAAEATENLVLLP